MCSWSAAATAGTIAPTLVDQDLDSQTLSVLLVDSPGAASLWVSFKIRWLSQYLSRVDAALVAFALGDASYTWRLSDDIERDRIIEVQLENDYVCQLEQHRREIRHVST